jgi:hypothetical protein
MPPSLAEFTFAINGGIFVEAPIEASNIIQFGLWGHDKVIPVPKLRSETLPDWAQVALAGWSKGWRKWLDFWGISRVKRSTNGQEPIARSIPGHIEMMALRDLSGQAQLLATAKGSLRVTLIERTMIALEQHYMRNYEKTSFYADYHLFAETYAPEGLQLSHRYMWIADRLQMYYDVMWEYEEGGVTKIGKSRRPAARSVGDALDVASARIQLLEKWDMPIDLDVNISRLLKGSRRRAA